MSNSEDYQRILLAIELWREGRSLTPNAMLGIAYVNLNRVQHPGWWGKSLIEVITHKWQFSSMTASGDPNLVQWPQEGDPKWIDALEMAQRSLTGGPDITNGAVYYWTYPLTQAPKEWGPVTETCIVDGVHFCK